MKYTEEKIVRTHKSVWQDTRARAHICKSARNSGKITSNSFGLAYMIYEHGRVNISQAIRLLLDLNEMGFVILSPFVRQDTQR